MAHAVVIHVKLPDGGRSDEGRRMLDEVVVPNAKSQPGFKRGIWMNNGEDGRAVVVFDSEEQAQSALNILKPPPGGPTLLSSEVYEVAVEA